VRDGKPAVTHYRIERKYRAHTGLRVRLETGRTHQIRVHMAHAGFPLVGDPAYGGRPRLPRAPHEDLRVALANMRRQALHAGRLELSHPGDGRWLICESPPPADFQALIDGLQRDLDACV